MPIELDTSMYDDKWPNGQPMELTVIGPRGGRGTPMVSFRIPDGPRIVCSLIHFNDQYNNLWDDCKAKTPYTPNERVCHAN